jgi:diaminopimelate epimerase
MHFTKMHGLGNDYLYVFGEVPKGVAELSHRLSDRHFGAGSDGMIFIGPSPVADFKMRIFNADGSEALMCGNGIRCVGKYVYDRGFTKKTALRIETLSGIKDVGLTVLDGQVERVTVGMGTAEVREALELDVRGTTVRGIPVSVGNPHYVVFVEDAETAPVDTLGPVIERHEAFAGGVNVEFAQVLANDEIRMRVWERGSGITMACGTGACATAAAAVAQGMCPHGRPITVHLDGGDLHIRVSGDYAVTMTGPATTVFEGDVAL